MKQQNNIEYRGLTNKDRQDLVSLFKGDYLPKELQGKYWEEFRKKFNNSNKVFSSQIAYNTFVSDLVSFKEEIIRNAHISNSDEQLTSELSELVKKYDPIARH